MATTTAITHEVSGSRINGPAYNQLVQLSCTCGWTRQTATSDHAGLLRATHLRSVGIDPDPAT